MSEQLSPKAIIAESIIENFEAVSSYVARQSLRDMLDENQALRAENARLQQLLEDVLHTFGYLRFHRVAGMDGLLYETHNKMSPERTIEACEKRIRATLAAKDVPHPPRRNAMNEVKRYKLLQSVCYDDGAFVIPAGQVMVTASAHDDVVQALRTENARLRRAEPAHFAGSASPGSSATVEIDILAEPSCSSLAWAR